MTIIEQALIISAGFIILFLVLIIQSVSLARWHRAPSYYLQAVGWFILGGVRVWNFYKLPANWMKLREQGWQPPEYLSAEQYIVTALVTVALVLFIIGYDRRRVALQSL